ncbi:GntR family transcriptional regulator [Roseibium sp. SCP14]|uniref:GntR family transcriptional regulator n=1 Tax=Roseibium sp. SCP14 TaxID=3141375 RepID=UPI003335C06D
MPRPRNDTQQLDLLDTLDADAIDRTRPIGPQVYELIRLAIVLSHLPPDTQINEPELSKALGVSRTPLRQAYQKLASEGLIISRPQVGSVVASVDNDLIKEGITIRRALEREVVRALCDTKADLGELEPLLAVQRIAVRKDDYVTYFRSDEEFHRQLAYIAEIPAAWRLALSVKGHADRARLSLMKANPKRIHRAFAEHLELIDACQCGDFEKAERVISQHVNAIRDVFED